jgi:hypothetical protein
MAASWTGSSVERETNPGGDIPASDTAGHFTRDWKLAKLAIILIAIAIEALWIAALVWLIAIRAGIDHLGEAAALGLHQHVGQEQGERLAADEFACAPHLMPETER